LHSFSQKVKFLEQVFGKGSLGSSGNLDVWCPICAPLSKTKKKLAIKVEQDFVKCWVCEYKSRNLDFLIRKYGTSSDLQEYHQEFAFDKTRLVTIAEEKKEELILPKGFKLLAETNAMTFANQALFHYVASRGLKKSDMWFYKLGYSADPKWARRVIVPSFDLHGNLNYFVARSIDKKVGLRYLNPLVERCDIIFNEINIDWKKPLNLCEGSFDMMKCPPNSVCLLGSFLSEKYVLFKRIVEHETPVTIILDSDKRDSSAVKIAQLLTQYGIKVKIADLPPDKDPGSMTKKEVFECISQATDFSWKSNFFARLGKASKTSASL
jgi:hypothetical protein